MRASMLSADRRRHDAIDRASRAIAQLELPPAVFKTCPWQPRELVETGLRQWLRCCAAALRDDQVIGMPSHAVDEAWHGLILCTMRYQAFCFEAYGKFMHHNPVGGAPDHVEAAADPMEEQLRRTVIAWTLVASPERAVCALGSRPSRRCRQALGCRAGAGSRDSHGRNRTARELAR